MDTRVSLGASIHYSYIVPYTNALISLSVGLTCVMNSITEVSPKKYSCMICHGCIPCNGCTIKELRDHVKRLEEALNFILSISSEQLKLNRHDITDLLEFDRSNSPMPFEIPDLSSPLLPHWKFFTLTFDANKFGISNDPESEKNYILHQILTVYKKNLIRRPVYGCFEHHKSGKVHAHFIAFVIDNTVGIELRKAFTDNPRNKHAVDIGYAKFPNCIKYIEKESTDYFQLKNHLEL